jgi:hypothetical protein
MRPATAHAFSSIVLGCGAAVCVPAGWPSLSGMAASYAPILSQVTDATGETLASETADFIKAADALGRRLEHFDALMHRMDQLAPRLELLLDRVEPLLERWGGLLGSGSPVRDYREARRAAKRGSNGGDSTRGGRA